MRGEERLSRLVAGASPGEFLATALALGLIVYAAATYLPVMVVRSAETEAFMGTTQSRVHWVETWANDGVLPPAATPVFDRAFKGKYLHTLEFEPGTRGDSDGSVTFLFNASMPALEGEMLTFRPAFSPGDAPYAVAWICGHAPAPRGFVLRGVNRTSFDAGKLLARCRGPLS